MGRTFWHPTCQHCGAQRRHQATGRPGEYCSTKCRQAAHRQRQAAADPPDTEEFDQALCMQLTQIARAAHSILDARSAGDARVRAPGADGAPPDPRRTPHAPHGGPHRAARRVMGTHRRRARHRTGHRAQEVVPVHPPHITPRPGGVPITTPGLAPRHHSAPRSRQRRRRPVTHRATPEHRGGLLLPPLAGQDLATVLSSLQCASGLSLRTLAGRTGLSASHLSRLMNGERFPTWENVAVLARACGADPDAGNRESLPPGRGTGTERTCRYAEGR